VGSILTAVEEFGRLQGAWNRLCLAHTRPNPMLSWDWLSTWWSVYGAPDERLSLAIWVKEVDGQLVAGLPLYRTSGPGGAVYRIIGAGADDATDAVCADYLGPMVMPEHGAAIDEMAADIAELIKGDHGDLSLTDLTEAEASCETLFHALRRKGLTWHRSKSSTCPFLRLPESYDAFLSSLSHNFRGEIRQSERNWLKMPNPEIRRVEAEADLEPFWDALVVLHRKRWATRGMPGVFDNPRFATFHRGIMAAFLRQGWLDAAVIHGGGAALAAVYGFRMAPTTFTYQGGTDPALPRKLRPGLVLDAHMIRRAIERKDLEYDFMRGEEKYKARFTDRSRQLFRVEAGRRTPLRLCRYLARDCSASWQKLRRHASRLRHGE
jgi:CelD/BcsL family acetyltransferase involved in cellulose biosynthesis